MTTARADQVHLDSTPYYHCISRCVRRAFLCGEDRLTGKSFDHRKAWLVDRIRQLSEVFAIDVCAYAVMSNHYHVVLRVDAERLRDFSNDEVLARYGKLFRRSVLELEVLPEEIAAERLALFRERLGDLSWFMRCLNESIARRANREDGCKGRFWEGRFRCQALLDEAALLTCMSYVDLNPVRAGLSTSLHGSDFTSIQQRLREQAVSRHERRQNRTGKPKRRGVPLVRFSSGGGHALQPGRGEPIPMDFGAYVELLRWTGSSLREGKPGALPPVAQGLLDELGVDAKAWLPSIAQFQQRFFQMVGHAHRIELECERLGQRHAKGSRWAAKLYRDAA